MTMATNEHNLLDFQDPGTIGEELTDVPGFVNSLKNHTLAVSPRPNPVLAFGGALAMLAHLSGRTYRDRRGTRTNLYLAALAPTGMGKEEPRETNIALATEIGIRGTLPDAIASGEGLEDAIARSPSLLLQNDEADALLTAMRGSDSRASRLNEMILRFFSESKSSHAIRQKAGDGSVKTIMNPHLTLFATGIPKFFYEALTEKALTNGLLGRCLFLETEEFIRLGKMEPEPLPAEVVDTAKFLAAREQSITDTGVIDPIVIGETPDGERKIRELFDSCDTVTERLRESELETAAALYIRLPEKAVKLAMLWALSENCEHPVISADAVIWATKLASHLTKRMLYQAQFYVSEGKFDRLKKRFLAMLAKHGGQCDRTAMLRHLAIDSETFSKIVKTLHMCDLIEEEQLDRRKVIYTLKAA